MTEAQRILDMIRYLTSYECHWVEIFSPNPDFCPEGREQAVRVGDWQHGRAFYGESTEDALGYALLESESF